jgi:formylglycine-generating enzyme required for sulfatase activity
MRTLGLVLLVALRATHASPLHAQDAIPGVEWVRIPAGTFQMGCISTEGPRRCDADEYPRHAVTITRPFDMMATEVTARMFRAFTPLIEEQPAWSMSPDQPVAIVTWDDAVKFCKAVGGRLPTEAEWEYAARGGRAGTVYPWGDQAPDDRPGAANGAAFEGDSPRAVKTFRANGFGLYDMAGNVWEWVNDWYSVLGPEPVKDPRGGEGGGFRVVRGGSYGDDMGNLRVSNRNPNRPGSRNVNVGFRCARDVR